MKVLMYGHLSIRLLHPMVSAIKKEDPSITFGLLGNANTFNQEEKDLISEIGEVHEIKISPIPLSEKFLLALKILKWEDVKGFIKNFFSIKKTKRDFSQKYNLERKRRVILDLINKNRYQVFQIHYLSPKNLEILDLIPEKTKIVLSVWGSDLMVPQKPLAQTYEAQLKAFQRADAITIHSVEMRQILLAKYGFDLAPKVVLTLFGVSEDKFDKMDSIKAVEKEPNRFRILVGYNATPQQQHIEVIDALVQLPKAVQEKLELIFPLTYGKQYYPEYLDLLLKKISTTSIKSQILTQYLPEGQILSIMKGCDLMINVPFSDAMNSAMVEMLYMDKIVINGAWLPYQSIKRQGINYIEIEQINNLITLIHEITIAPHEFLHSNSKLVKRFVKAERYGKQWTKAIS